MPYTLKTLIKEMHCANCGKDFVWFGMIRDYLYKGHNKKNRRVYFCSEHCMNEYKEKRK